jgi:hypothetical protein
MGMLRTIRLFIPALAKNAGRIGWMQNDLNHAVD